MEPILASTCNKLSLFSVTQTFFAAFAFLLSLFVFTYLICVPLIQLNGKGLIKQALAEIQAQ